MYQLLTISNFKRDLLIEHGGANYNQQEFIRIKAEYLGRVMFVWSCQVVLCAFILYEDFLNDD